jgi:3',5'-cyclic AMP phosphodiesterase CpdA
LRISRLAAVAVLIALVVVALNYRRQLYSRATHWKGSPKDTVEFVAFPTEPAPLLHLAVAGDVGDSGKRLDRTAAAITEVGRRSPFDVLWLLGDNVYPSGDPAKLPETVFGPFGPVLDSGTELLAIVGNHDVRDGHGEAQMAALGMPGMWWSKERNGVLMVGLDSNQADNPQQLAWLERTLTNSKAVWKIVALHHPPYSAGYQGSSTEVRAKFSPLFTRHGVQLVLSGHDHDYQRSVPLDGVTYVVSGAAAGTRRTGEKSFTAVSFSWHHFTDVTVFPDRLVVRAVNQELRVADEATILPAGIGP